MGDSIKAIILILLISLFLFIGFGVYRKVKSTKEQKAKNKASQALINNALYLRKYEAKQNNISAYSSSIGIEVLGRVYLSEELALEFTIDYYQDKYYAPKEYQNLAKRSPEEQSIYDHFVKNPATGSATVIKTAYVAITKVARFHLIRWDQFEIFDSDISPPTTFAIEVSGKETVDSLKAKGFGILHKQFGFTPKQFHVEIEKK